MIKIESKFMTKIVSKFIQHSIKKKFKCLTKVNLNNFTMAEENEEINFHLDIEAKIKNEDFLKLLETIEKES